MCSSMMGGLSIDADLMESLTPEPFTNVKYPFLPYILLKILNSNFVILFYFLFSSYSFFSILAVAPIHRQW